ncbi:MAG: hypothetical protein ACLQU1_42930 [Bryobacteraceae bacterium]
MGRVYAVGEGEVKGGRVTSKCRSFKKRTDAAKEVGILFNNWVAEQMRQ